MFETMKLETDHARLGLNWAVVKVDYAGSRSNFAYCKTKTAASKVADALNATAIVSTYEAE